MGEVQLYNLSIEVYKDRSQSFQHIQEKASKYFAVLTFLLGFSLYYAKWVFDDLPITLVSINWIMLLTSGILITFLIITWFFILRILQIENFKVLPLDDELMKFFVDNKQIDIYYGMSKGVKLAIEQNNIVHEKKSGLLNISYKLLKIDTVLIILSLILYVIKYYQQYG